MGDLVLYSCEDRVATITYNRPEALNAINGALRADLNAAFARFRDDDAAWVAIVTGAGRAFCAGADLADPGSASGEFAGSFWERPTVNSFESGWEIFKPVIAAVNGHCLDLVDLVSVHHVEIATVTAGDVDFATASGRLHAKLGADIAQHESEHKAERQRTANAHRRAEGKKSSGGRFRRFGYHRDDVHLDPIEAPLVRAAVARLLGGGSLHSVAVEWNNAGITASGGRPWRPNSLRRYLESPHLAGWFSFAQKTVMVDGEPVRGPQEILIDPDDWATLRARFASGVRNPGQSVRSRLLAGFLLCGKEGCGAKLYAHRTGAGKPSYACRKVEGGCGGLSSLAEPVDTEVEARLLALFTLENADALARILAAMSDTDNAPILAELGKVEGEVDRIEDLLCDGAISKAKGRDRIAAAKARRVELQRALGRTRKVSHPVGDTFPAWWRGAALTERRDALATFIIDVTILPAKVRGATVFDPERVQVHWQGLAASG